MQEATKKTKNNNNQNTNIYMNAKKENLQIWGSEKKIKLNLNKW